MENSFSALSSSSVCVILCIAAATATTDRETRFSAAEISAASWNKSIIGRIE